jgi:hypothetical protein
VAGGVHGKDLVNRGVGDFEVLSGVFLRLAGGGGEDVAVLAAGG